MIKNDRLDELPAALCAATKSIFRKAVQNNTRFKKGLKMGENRILKHVTCSIFVIRIKRAFA